MPFAIPSRKITITLLLILSLGILRFMEIKIPTFNYALIYLNLAEKFKGNDPSKELNAYHKALYFDPFYTTTHFYLAQFYEKLGNENKKLEYYENILKLGPDPVTTQKEFARSGYAEDHIFAEANYQIGHYYLKQNLAPRAAYLFREAVQFNRGHKDALFELGRISLYQLHDVPAATEYKKRLGNHPYGDILNELIEPIRRTLPKR